MSLKQCFFLFLTVLASVGLGLGVAVVRGMFLPTRGKRIGTYPTPTKALLVLDVQESSAGPVRSRSFEAMIATINRLVEHFSRSGMVVAYVRQVFDNDLIIRLHGGRILSGRL